MHKSMIQHLDFAQSLNINLIDIPECILEATEENEDLFNYLLMIIDCIYSPMISNKFLKYNDVIDLYETFLRLNELIKDLNSIKIIAIDYYLNQKLESINNYAINCELYEVVHNIKTFNDIKEEIKNYNII